MTIYILLSIFIILQLLDIYTTKRNLLNRRGVEYNRYIRYLIDRFGFWRAIIPIKIFTVIAVSVASLYIQSISELAVFILLCALNLFYAAVITFNSGFNSGKIKL